MKNFTLGFMYLLVFSLLIYSCTKEDSIDQPASKFQLVSPDNFVLASSDAELKEMIKKELLPIYGQNYEFDITSIYYVQDEDITYADINYTTINNRHRNFIFFWPKAATDKASHRVDIEPQAAPTCKGECYRGEDCPLVRKKIGGQKVWLCDCNGSGGNNCQLIVDGEALQCTGGCDDSSDQCEPAYNPAEEITYCRCQGGSHQNCKPTYSDVQPVTIKEN